MVGVIFPPTPVAKTCHVTKPLSSIHQLYKESFLFLLFTKRTDTWNDQAVALGYVLTNNEIRTRQAGNNQVMKEIRSMR